MERKESQQGKVVEAADVADANSWPWHCVLHFFDPQIPHSKSIKAASLCCYEDSVS